MTDLTAAVAESHARAPHQTGYRGDVRKYSDDQARDDHGRWTSDGGSSAEVEDDAKNLVADATAAEPRTTAALTEIGKLTGGNLDSTFRLADGTVAHTLDHRLKGLDSTEEKIKNEMRDKNLTEDQAVENIHDSLRYTLTYPGQTYAAGAEHAMDAMIKDGWTPVRGRNYWGHEDGYAGVNTLWKEPGGHQVELQFHTPETLQFKESDSHPLYEALRDLPTGSSGWMTVQKQIDDGWLRIREKVPYLDDLNNFLHDRFPATD